MDNQQPNQQPFPNKIGMPFKPIPNSTGIKFNPPQTNQLSQNQIGQGPFKPNPGLNMIGKINQSQLIGGFGGQSIGQPIGQPIGQSIGQPIGAPIGGINRLGPQIQQPTLIDKLKLLEGLETRELSQSITAEEKEQYAQRLIEAIKYEKNQRQENTKTVAI